jgi:hypothetical protein
VPIESSNIVGHSDLEMTGEYTCVSHERQNELTRRIQRRLRDTGGNSGKKKIMQLPVAISGAPDVEHVLSIDGNGTTNDTPAPN